MQPRTKLIWRGGCRHKGTSTKAVCAHPSEGAALRRVWLANACLVPHCRHCAEQDSPSPPVVIYDGREECPCRACFGSPRGNLIASSLSSQRSGALDASPRLGVFQSAVDPSQSPPLPVAVSGGMAADTISSSIRPLDGPGALLRLAPVPLFPLQPLLGRIVRKIAALRPEIFDRIGPHTAKCFIIDPENMPFVLVLHPDPERPRLRAALFFTRELVIEGDTEAAVCLRNALDDLDGSIADDIADMFGPPGRAALALLRRVGNHDDGRGHDPA